LFGDDQRLRREYKTTMEFGGFKLKAEARTPYGKG
jgi:hypothetical protein